MTDVTKFIDKETGEIHIGEAVIGPNTRWEDFERLAPYAEISGDDTTKCLDFKTKLIAENIPVQVELTLFAEDNDSMVMLMCEPPEEYDAPKKWNYIWLAAGKVWLKAVLGEPDWEDESFIVYRYSWGKIIIGVVKDQRGDIRGGEIEVNYIRERV